MIQDGIDLVDHNENDWLSSLVRGEEALNLLTLLQGFILWDSGLRLTLRMRLQI